MSYESYKPSPDFLMNQVSLASLELFADERKFSIFNQFEQAYTNNPEPIVVDRGAGDVAYQAQILSGATTSGSHLFMVRRAQFMVGHRLDSKLHYFVASADFATGDTTEWLLRDGVVAPIEDSDGLKLVLSHDPVHEVSQNVELSPGLSIIDAITLRGLKERADAIQAAQEISLIMPKSGAAVLSWGAGHPAETFKDMGSVRRDLMLLGLAEQNDMLGGIVGHQLVHEYLRRAA